MTETSFVPGPETARAFRDALGCYGTGVTVVTTMTCDGPLAMTANSFASVSLDPPLVLWCPAKASLRHDAFADARHYNIHVMAEDQHNVAHGFARSGTRFDLIDWTPGSNGQPVLRGCLARFECHRTALHDAGDHSIILGHVDKASHRDGRGLIFKRGQYGGFSGLV